jgi:hypothetical protein
MTATKIYFSKINYHVTFPDPYQPKTLYEIRKYGVGIFSIGTLFISRFVKFLLLAQKMKQVEREHIHRLTKTVFLTYKVCISISILIFRLIMAYWKICTTYIKLDSIRQNSH